MFITVPMIFPIIDSLAAPSALITFAIVLLNIMNGDPRRNVFGGAAPAPASAGLEPAERVAR